MTPGGQPAWRLAAHTSPGGEQQQMTTSGEHDGRLSRLEQQMEQISGRLAALEQAARHPAPVPHGPWAAPSQPSGPGGPDAGETEFSYYGRGRFGFGNDHVCARRARLSDIMDADPNLAAKVFAALANPARITVLRALLNGPRTSQQLRAELDDASVGHLYHHLRELMAVGLITQPARSQYAITRGSQVPLCMQILTAEHLTQGLPRPAIPEEEPAETAGDQPSPQ